jgi:phage baseplate assembly protein W
MATLYPIGLTLPIQNGDGGFFAQTIYTLEQAKTNIINLLNTSKGERRMQPTFGHSLNSFVFDQNDSSLSDKIKQSLINDIGYWVPIATVDNIDIKVLKKEDVDIYRLYINMTISVNNDKTSIEMFLENN